MARRRRRWPDLGEPLPSPVMDNHTHLPLAEREIPNASGYRMPLEEQMARALQVRVTRMITVGCELGDLEPTLELARQWPEVKAALAIHPNEAALHAGYVEKSPDGYEHTLEGHHRIPLVVALEKVAELLKDPEVVAVGETGLDYFRTAGPGREAQREAFEAHLEMGRVFDLPVQIHDRDAHEDTVAVLEDAAWADQPIVFHSFSGGVDLAAEVASNGWYASFSGPITYPANDELRRAFLKIPRDRVLVETDAPYLTPVPHRGSPNASYVMPYTVRKIAELWEVSDEEASRVLYSNSVNLYGRW